MEWCYELGISTITVYAFSTENFKRSPEEVSMLMSLAVEKFAYMAGESEMVRKYDMAIRVIGELGMLPGEVREAAERAMEMTKNNKSRAINICFPYNSSAELVSAANAILETKSEPTRLSDHLYTSHSPPVQIMVRTSGESRLSEFLCWQVSEGHAQMEFLDVLWPDFGFWHFLPILVRYQLDRLNRII